MKRKKILAFAGVVIACLSLSQMAYGARSNDYPTEAIADYVFGCMAANGQTRQSLERCSCSIDIIASILPYERYVEAETVMSMRQMSGEKSALFKTAKEYKDAVADLKRAQAESEMRCFR